MVDFFGLPFPDNKVRDNERQRFYKVSLDNNFQRVYSTLCGVHDVDWISSRGRCNIFFL